MMILGIWCRCRLGGGRIRRRRGLGMFLALGVALAAGLLGAGEVIVVEPRVGNGRLDCAIAF